MGVSQKTESCPSRRWVAFIVPLSLVLVLAAGGWALLSHVRQTHEDLKKHAVSRLGASVQIGTEICNRKVEEKSREHEEEVGRIKATARAVADNAAQKIKKELSQKDNSWRKEVSELICALPWGPDLADTVGLKNDAARDSHEAQLKTLKLEKSLPPEMSLTITGKGNRQVLAIGAKAAGGIVASRELSVGEQSWVITAQAPFPEKSLRPSAGELMEKLSQMTFDSNCYQGILLDADGVEVGRYPKMTEPPAMPDEAGVWRQAGGKLARVELLKADNYYTVGALVFLPHQSDISAVWQLVTGRWQWSFLAGVLVLLTFVSAIRACLLTPVSRERPALSPRVTPKPSSRVVSEDASLIVADVDNGMVRVSEVLARRKINGSSLKRLQELHRGMALREGCRILDHARSPLLRAIAQKVRPPSASKLTQDSLSANTATKGRVGREKNHV